MSADKAKANQADAGWRETVERPEGTAGPFGQAAAGPFGQAAAGPPGQAGYAHAAQEAGQEGGQPPGASASRSTAGQPLRLREPGFGSPTGSPGQDGGRAQAPGLTSIRRTLNVIVLAGLLPMGLFAAVLFYFLWQNQQTLREQDQLARVRTQAALVQSELNSSIHRLELLARSPDITPERMPAFYNQVRAILADSPDWGNILLISRDAQVFNARFDWGTPLPPLGDQPYQREAFTGKPTTSDLFVARTRRIETVDIAVPVTRGASVPYVLIAGLKRDHLRDVLRSMSAPEDVTAVYDRNLRFLARTRDQDNYYGQTAGRALAERMKEGGSGTARLVSKEGIPVFTSWAPLENGWWVAGGTPSEPADRTILFTLGGLALAWLTMLLLGLVAGRIFWGRIETSLAAAAEAARRRAAGDNASFPQARFSELHALTEAVDQMFTRERRARAEAESANAAKDQFLAMLGHELRNPIGAISNASYILGQNKPGSPGDGKARAVVQRQSGILKRMIDDLLDISRVLTGRISLELRPLDMEKAVRLAVDALAASGRLAQHVIDLRTAPVWVMGDAARIEQVLSNLISNAANHTPAGRVIHITLEKVPGRPRLSPTGAPQISVDGDALFTVRDEGVGIAASTLPRVFDLFFQEAQKIDRPKSGLGLGLTLVQRLTYLHGGEALAASEGIGHGATFTICLPGIAAPGAMDIPIPVAPPRPAQKRILLIDDNTDVRESMLAVLEDAGHEVRAAGDGPTGIAALREFPAEFAVIDIGLPGMDGYQVAQAIRAAGTKGLDGAPLILIALTGYGRPEDKARALAAGFDIHFAKPLDLDALARLLAGGRAGLAGEGGVG